MTQASLFAHARDNRPRPWAGTWSEMKAILGRTYRPARGNPGGTPKQSMPAVSGAIYPPSSFRGIEFALGVGLLLLDVDNSLEEPTGEFWPNPRTGEPSQRPKMRKIRIEDPVGLEEVHAALRKAGLEAMAWTTWSSSPAWQKVRIVVPLASPVPVVLWERAASWALTVEGLEGIRRGIDLPVLHNATALAFLPGSPDPSTIYRAETYGVPLCVPLESLPPVRPAMTEWQQSIIADRTAELTAGHHWWQVYRVDGRPIDFQSLDLIGILQARGIKVGRSRSFKDGIKTRCHCPWAAEHSNHRDGDDAVVIHTPGTWPSFRCAHSGHRHMGLRDLLEWAWGTP